MINCYENIIYKKRAIETLSIILKDLKKKKVLFLASKTAYQNFGGVVTNELAKIDIEFCLKLLTSNCNTANIKSALDVAKNCDIVCALGGGSICDVAKIVSTKADIECVIIPAIPTTTAYFNDIAFVFEDGIYKKVETKHTYKILVDENFIAKCDKNFVIQGQKLLLSQFETLFSGQFDNLFFDTKKDLSALSMQLSKFKDNYEYLQSDTEDSKLVLMDILIELSIGLKKLPNNVFAFALCLKENTNLSFGSLCLICAKVLSKMYSQIFSLKKLYVFSMPNFERIDKNLKHFKIKQNKVNFIPIKNMLNNAVFLKVNSIKNQVFSLCQSFDDVMKEFVLPAEKNYLDENNLYKTFNITPLIYNCSSIVNLIYGVGLMNF